jgi:pyruvate dehydrogenase (quinone)
MGELLTAVHHRLPVKVIFDNAAFGLITLEAQSEGLLPFRQAIEFPNPDYEALARACGAQGFSVRDPARLQSTLVEAFACSGPAIVDCVVVADEMPNLPHVELDQVRGYALSRIKESIAAVTGG